MSANNSSQDANDNTGAKSAATMAAPQNFPPHQQQSHLVGHHAALSSIFSNFLDNLSAKLPPPNAAAAAAATAASTSAQLQLQPSTSSSAAAAASSEPGRNLRRTSDLLETLQAALAAPPPRLGNLQLPPPPQQSRPASANSADSSLYSCDAPVSRVPSSQTVPCFAGFVEVLAGAELVRTYRGAKPTDEADAAVPSAYVTFEARRDEAKSGEAETAEAAETKPLADERVIQSPDGWVFATPVEQRAAAPQWRQRFEPVRLPLELLSDPAKRFVLKVWCKSHVPRDAPPVQQPTPNDDSLIGYAVVNLSLLSVTAPAIDDWFNVTDVFGRINGRVHLRIGCNDSAVLDKYCAKLRAECPDETEGHAGDDQIHQTIKRKFCELEDITKRLKARLGDITDDANFEEILDDFENDLNTMPDETEAGGDEFDWLAVAQVELDGERVERLRSVVNKADGGGASSECDHLSRQLGESSLDCGTTSKQS